MITLILLGLMGSFSNGPKHQEQSRAGGTSAASHVQSSSSASSESSQDKAQTDTAQPRTAHDLTAAEKSALRKSAHFAKMLEEPLASQVFDLANQRIADQAAQRPSQAPESPNSEPTLTTDHEDYPPFSYVYFHGAGFQPGETVQMIVTETDPEQQAFEPWEVVADANGEFDTSWYIFSEEFRGATFQATATGQTSQLTASCTFTDAGLPYEIIPSFTLPNSTVTFDALVQDLSGANGVGSIRFTAPGQPTGADKWTITSASVTATSNNSTWSAGVVGGTPPNQFITFEASVNNAVPTNGWVRISITAHVGSNLNCGGDNCQDNWTAESWSDTAGTQNRDNSSNVGEIVNTCEPHDREYCAKFVQAAATLTTASRTSFMALRIAQRVSSGQEHFS